MSEGDTVKIDELGFERILPRCILWEIKDLLGKLLKKQSGSMPGR
jgi:hypothetical protein